MEIADFQCFRDNLSVNSPAKKPDIPYFSYHFASMDKLNTRDTWKRLRSKYRLVLINEDNYEEVAKFRITRLSMYVILSSLFVLMMAITTSLFIFTPLKYYLPGTGFANAKAAREFRKLKMRTDSMERALQYQQRYVDDIKSVLQGEVSSLDTGLLNLPPIDTIID